MVREAHSLALVTALNETSTPLTMARQCLHELVLVLPVTLGSRLRVLYLTDAETEAMEVRAIIMAEEAN